MKERGLEIKTLFDCLEYIQEANLERIQSLDQAVAWLLSIAFKYISHIEKTDEKIAKEMILHKIVHTGETMEAMYDILSREDALDEYFEAAMLAIISHDVGRFPQVAKHKIISDDKSRFDHAQASHAILTGEWSELIAPVPFANHPAFDDIATAILEHSKFKPAVESLLVALVRDADKLAILRGIVEFSDRFKMLRPQLTEASESISRTVIESFLDPQCATVVNGDVVTIADDLIAKLAFIFDINLQATKDILVEEGILDQIIAKIIEAADLDELIANRIRQRVADWKKAELPTKDWES
ncbi:MAG: hypothetical protein PVJ09_03715 [Candidatus Woesebacteria bacterium]|jgi:hypothetical protein